MRPLKANKGPLEAVGSLKAVLLLGVYGAVLAVGPSTAAQRAVGVDAYGQIEDTHLQSRFETITHQLRCLVCQNESIADSNADLARDLRQEVREKLIAGQSDQQIYQFMTDRYGEFVRFNPPLEPKTLLIWGAPFIVLALGGVIIFGIARQRSRMPVDDEPAPGPL